MNKVSGGGNMDIHENGVICTKSKLWKRRKIIVSIIDTMVNDGYHFLELVFGEPNNFVFADQYHEIEDVLKKKGFFGIRLKFQKDHTIFEIHSNTNGTNNVKYEIFTDSEQGLEDCKTHLDILKSLIGSSNEALVKGSEFLDKQSKVRNLILLLALLVGLYFLNVYVLLWNLVQIATRFLPFLFFLLLFDRYRRR